MTKELRTNNLYKLILCGFGFCATTAAPWMQQLSKAYEGSLRLCSRFWMNSASDSGRRRKPWNWVGEGFRPWLEATGMSRVTITTGIGEVKARQESAEEEDTTRIRRPGGGRKQLIETDSGADASFGVAGRSCDARRSHVAIALDVQEHPQTVRGTAPAETSRGAANGGFPVASSGIQPAGQSKNARRKATS